MENRNVCMGFSNNNNFPIVLIYAAENYILQALYVWMVCYNIFRIFFCYKFLNTIYNELNTKSILEEFSWKNNFTFKCN